MQNKAILSRNDAWSKDQDASEQIVQGIARLNREKGVLVRIYGVPMLGLDAADILTAHRKTSNNQTHPQPCLDISLAIVKDLLQRDLPACRLDLGKLSTQARENGCHGGNDHGKNDPGKNDPGKNDLAKFIDQQLTPLMQIDRSKQTFDVVLYGFGRIGRLLARQFIERAGAGNPLRLRAVVVRPDHSGSGNLEKRISLLKRDSVHGQFNAFIDIDHDKQSFVANGQEIRLITSRAPEEIDYQAFGFRDVIVIDNTGAWRDETGLRRHLQAKGVAKVLLTAPGRGNVKNIVFGVNEDKIESRDQILSAASCTTNAITPVLKILHEKYGIEYGHVETVHSYTNDQNLTDNFHKADRRGRAAPLNMVITSTSAASAVAKAYPPLAGKLTGNAIRVPTPNVSLAILNLHLSQTTTRSDLNHYLAEVAHSTNFQKQIGYMDSNELVSSDLTGSRFAGIVDSNATICQQQQCILYVWYDNEFGYSTQVYRVLQEMVGIKFMTLPV